MLQRWIGKCVKKSQQIHPVCLCVFFSRASRLHQSADALHLRADVLPYISTCPLTSIFPYCLCTNLFPHSSHKIAQPTSGYPPTVTVCLVISHLVRTQRLIEHAADGNFNRLWRTHLLKWRKAQKAWDTRCAFSELQMSAGVSDNANRNCTRQEVREIPAVRIDWSTNVGVFNEKTATSAEEIRWRGSGVQEWPRPCWLETLQIACVHACLPEHDTLRKK